jgi:hypothetical protein
MWYGSSFLLSILSELRNKLWSVASYKKFTVSHWHELPVNYYLLIHSQVLQCGAGPSYDFLAKILGIDTPLFLLNTLFDFSLLHCYAGSLVKGLCDKLLTAQLVACLPLTRATQVWFPRKSFSFSNNHVCNGFKMHLLQLFILFFFSLFSFKNDGSTVVLSVCCIQN